MKKYKVIKAFFKLSEKKNYAIDDVIELTDEEAKAMDWYVVAIKANELKLQISGEDLKRILNKSKK